MHTRIYFIILICSCIFVCQSQRLRGRLRSSTFSREMKDVTPGAASLAFVFDVTGSMWDDLRQVTAGAKRILDTTLNRQEKPLHDYILVPFHDPVVGPITVTSDGDLFQRRLRNLFVQGGGDCPEMSLTAIKESLEIALPSSFIYVFTDATAKDYGELRNVLEIIQRKQSQVVFVLTGDCNNKESPGYKAYEKIAATSSGQVFFITKDDVSEVVKFIEVSVQAHKVVLLATDHEAGGGREWEIPFDPELKEVTISLSGQDRKLLLTDPKGQQYTERNGLITLLDLDSVLIVNIKNATSGMWRVSANSSGEHSLRITGLSTLDFQARFSPEATLDWHSTGFQPVEGALTYMLLNSTGLGPTGQFQKISLRDISGFEIMDIRFQAPQDPDQPYLYAPDPFKTPEDDFYVYVTGFTKDYYPFQRATKNAVLNIVPVAPLVIMEPSHPGYFDYPADIPCKVSSLIPFHIVWSRNVGGHWIPVGAMNYYHQSTTAYLRINDVTEEAEGMYRCFANNSKGHDYGITFLDVEERPPIVRVNGNVTAEPNSEAILTCHVSSNSNFTVSWSRQEIKPFDETRTRMLQNNSLAITHLVPKDAGYYECSVTNSGGNVRGHIYLTIEAAPTALVRPRKPVKFVEGDKVYLRCLATGYPQPSIVWLNGSQIIKENEHIIFRRRGSEIRFMHARPEHDGVYVCKADNDAGTAVDDGRLIYTEIPTVSVHPKKSLIEEGQSITIQCLATGIPTPRIAWYFEGSQLSSGSRHFINPKSLMILSLQNGDRGEYSCQAGNEVGLANDSMQLEIGLKPQVTVSAAFVEIAIDSPNKIGCQSSGYPTPEITWSKLHAMSMEGNDAVFEMIIDTEPSRIYHDLSSNSLVIKSMGMGDQGTYFCSATNQFGSDAKSSQVAITGLVAPRIGQYNPRSHVILGESVELPCAVVSGNPQPIQQWVVDNKAIEDNERIHVNDDGSLILEEARLDDLKNYTCTATNVVGFHKVISYLDIWVPPSIETSEKMYETIEGLTVSLECVANGNPEPEVDWFKNGSLSSLRGQSDFRILSDNTLLIELPDRRKTGTYTCIAANDVDIISIVANLEVYYKPEVINEYKNFYQVKKGNPVTLVCPITSGNPKSKISWQFNGLPIAQLNGGLKALEIHSALVADDGQYTCFSENRAGIASANISLSVIVPPTIRGPKSIKVLAGEDIMLSCEVHGIPLPVSHWLQNSAEMMSSKRFRVSKSYEHLNSYGTDLLIRPALLSDDGEYICLATNIGGSFRHTILLDVQQRPSIFTNGIDHHQTPSKGTNLEIPCVANGDPTPTIRWYHNGVEILDESFKREVTSNGSLFLYSVDSEDSGSYTCEAENSIGKANSTTEVTVYEPPEILGSDGITNIWVIEGEFAEMICSAKAVPRPVVTWHKSGVRAHEIHHNGHNRIELSNERNVLNITSAQVSDSGDYYCMATNVEGITKKHFRLEVYALPRIDNADQDDIQNVVLGVGFTLKCDAKGIPPPKIRWFKGSLEILPENERMHIDSNGKILAVDDSVLDDQGSYYCFAENSAGRARKNHRIYILVPPTIIGEDDNVTQAVPAGEYHSIRCSASGIPPPKISWYREGQAVTLGNEGSGSPIVRKSGMYLVFANINLEDEGTYMCEAVNEAGKASKFHTVDVLVPPTFLEIENNLTVVEGNNATFYCRVSGDPAPTVKWMMNGKLIHIDHHYKISQTGEEILITDSSSSDVGKFTCQASNSVSAISRNQYLDVFEMPTISGPENVIVKVQEGERVILNCIVDGNPVPFIRWRRNKSRIKPDERMEFSISNQRFVIHRAVEHDSAEYECVASNIVGSNRKTFMLKVQVFPKVLPFSKEYYEVLKSDNLQIPCRTTGIPEPKIRWLRNGIALEKSRNFKFREGGKLLVIMNAQIVFHEGTYTCVASNSIGEDFRNVEVVVLVPPSIFGQEIVSESDIAEGDEISLACLIEEGKPIPKVHWYFEDNNLETDINAIWNFNRTTEILSNSHAAIDNAGMYRCIASNKAGMATKQYHVNIEVEPYILGDEKEMKYIIQNNNITFTCEVSGIPSPNVTWTRNGVVLSEAQETDYIRTAHLGDEVFQLTVIQAKKEDEAEYSCIATNHAGEDSKTFHLSVYIPPSSANGDQQQNIIIYKNDSYEIFCDVEAFPIPIIRWYKNGRPMSIATEEEMDFRVLPIPHAQLSDAGHYKCEAENIAGIIDKHFQVQVYAPPTVIGDDFERIKKLLGDQIILDCDIRGVPPPSLEWLKDRQPLPVNERFSLLQGSKTLAISNAELYDDAEYKCIGKSRAGNAVKSFDVTIHEPAVVLGPKHQDIIVNKGDSFKLECKVTGTPLPVIQWYKNNRIVFPDSRHSFLNGTEILLVIDSREDDEKDYYCNATNVEAYDTKQFTVQVIVPPLIDFAETDYWVKEGHNINLTCDAYSNSQLILEWFFEDQPIVLSSTIQLSPNDKKLMLFNTPRSRAGKYSCAASNSAGTHKVDMQLHVFTSSSIQGPEYVELNVTASHSLVLVCNASGFPIPTIQWSKDHVSIEDILASHGQYVIKQKESVLKVLDADDADAGIYQCKAANDAGFATKQFSVNVLYPPEILRVGQSDSIWAGEGSSTLLECTAVGNPPPKISWLKDGLPIEENEHYSINNEFGNLISYILLRNITVEVAGVYECVAENAVGQDEFLVNVNVNVVPVIQGSESSPINIQESVGNMVGLECNITKGLPKPQIVWFSGSRKVISGERLKILNDGQLLRIARLRPSDSSVYRCIAKNDQGIDSKEFHVFGLEPPHFDFNEKDDLNVMMDLSFIITCDIYARPLPKIQWLKDGVPLLQDGNYENLHKGHILRVKSARLENSGVYSCLAVNDAGSDTQNTRVNVLTQPNIFGDPTAEIDVLTGGSTFLNCTTDGHPQPKITWYRNGAEIHLPSDHLQNYDYGQILSIKDARLQESGRYECYASNSVGWDIKQFKINVQAPPIIQGSEYQELVMLEGRNYDLLCQSHGIPPAMNVWYKDDEIIHDNQRYSKIRSGFKLRVNSADENDNGLFICEAKNIAGKDRKVVNVTVYMVPELVGGISNEDTSVLFGQNVTLDCDSDTYPRPKVRWSKRSRDLVILNNTKKYQISEDGFHFTILDANTDDADEYECELSNDAGLAFKRFNVIVHRKPSIFGESITILKKAVGAAVHMKCEVDGYPYPEVIWLKNGHPLIFSDRIRYLDTVDALIIDKIVKSDTGEYSCIARNIAGEAHKSFTLDVLSRPFIDKTIGSDNVQAMTHKEVTFTCAILHSNPPATVEWFKGRKNISTFAFLLEYGQVLSIPRVKLTDSGKYRCVATNLEGQDHRDFSLTVLEPPKLASNLHPKHLEVIATSPATLHCDVSGGTPRPEAIWLHNGQRLLPSRRIKTFDNGKRLAILHTMIGDSGEYACTAFNKAGSITDTSVLDIHVPPVISSRENTDIKLVTGDNVTLDCSVDGIPYPRVSWTYNTGGENTGPLEIDSRKQIGSDGEVVFITDLHASDSGTYNCIASSISGVDQKTFNVFVMEPPKIQAEDYNISVVEHSVLRLGCQASGIPIPSLYWLKNGDVLPAVGDLRIQENGHSLVIEDSQVEDAGEYECIASSDAGTATKLFHVDVIRPPTSGNGNNITAVVGSNVLLDCLSDASPPPKFIWLKNGSPIDHYAHLLLLKNVQPTHEGFYECRATNDAGTSTRKIGLKIYRRPVIQQGPRNYISLVHETIILACVADGIPEPQLSWRKNSRAISQNNNERYRIGSNSLTISNLEFSDHGEYRCIATNNAGSDSRKMYVQVQEQPIIAEGPTDIMATVNSPVILPCEASGNPDPTISWSKNNISFNAVLKDGIRQDEQGFIHIGSATVMDSAIYTCVAKNTAGISSKNIKLTVQVPPIILNTISSYIVKPLTWVTVACQVYGVPQPSVYWNKNGLPIERFPGAFVNKQDHSLNIPQVAANHVGTYTCVANNSVGQSQFTIQIDARRKPRILKMSDSAVSLEGTSITLECNADGTPLPTISWKKGSKLIRHNNHYNDDGNGTLTIKNLQASAADTYTCVAQNIAGFASATMRLDVVMLPEIVANFRNESTAVAGETFVLPISFTGMPLPEIIWSKDGVDINFEDSLFYVSDETGSLIIPMVQPSLEGTYKVTAVNDAGLAEVSTSLTVQVPPNIHALEPEIFVKEGEPVLMEIMASGTPYPNISWSKSGKLIRQNQGRSHQSHNGHLIIDHAQASDTAVYVVTAVNNVGHSSAQVQVTVLVPPTFNEVSPDQEKLVGEDVALKCIAVGYPIPAISWNFNGEPIHTAAASFNASGTSLLLVENISINDAGTYSCEARNYAGTRLKEIHVLVNVPPFVIGNHEDRVTANLGETVRIDCNVTSIPPPVITWSKNGKELVYNERLLKLPNNSLLIDDTHMYDAGDYKCTAANKAGNVEVRIKLLLQVAPSFAIKPVDTVVDVGSNVLFNCTATGIPAPSIRWKKQFKLLPQRGRFNVLHNGSLLISSAQLKDSGEYQCISTNEIGSRMVSASLRTQVNGQFGEWNKFGPCTVTCGNGIQRRIRYCNSPSPANGGKYCEGSEEESRACSQSPCPVDGMWSSYGPWEPCSVTCGQGEEVRLRECNNPAPKYGGNPCVGIAVEKRHCTLALVCPVNGAWSSWGQWQPCSTTCGKGESIRLRLCTNPDPGFGGLECPGLSTEKKICQMSSCPVNGNWGNWGASSFCSVSCGRGTVRRVRMCDNPAPSKGGEPCPGSDVQIDICNVDPCPVNGAWIDWGIWSACSQSCGSGRRHRYRSCSNPIPRFGGKYCSGKNVQVQGCGMRLCPEDGNWGTWSKWMACSNTCGEGTRVRRRKCNDPPPRQRGRNCEGNSTQITLCSLQPCINLPRTASGILNGNINGIPITGSSILSHSINRDGKVTVYSVINGIPPAIGNDLKNQVSILAPIYWTFAKELNGAYNGYTLTNGVFQRQVDVEFPNGHLVSMYHNARGVNSIGELNVDIEVNGDIPTFSSDAQLHVKDYTEEYIQTGLDSLHAHSDRFYTVDDNVMLYTWTHDINYDGSLGVQMPYVAEQLIGRNIVTEYNKQSKELVFHVDVTITKGDSGNHCPEGFQLEAGQKFCNDIDECSGDRPCSGSCLNLIGSYICECPDGFHLGMDGKLCEDTDECSEELYQCDAPLECKNTRGSYRCIISCGTGLRISEDDQSCIDINECDVRLERLCEHTCQNTYGSFSCKCRPGYATIDDTRCEDIDECSHGACYGDVNRCVNTEGSYTCTQNCPPGYKFDFSKDSCKDIDECINPLLNHCDQRCENVEGSYRCLCRTGYIANETMGTCRDFDECQHGRGPCQYGCINTEGSYKCFCPTGYRLVSNGHSCEDINECLEGDPKCLGIGMLCANMLGDYDCVKVSCPPGYEMTNNICSRDCGENDCGGISKRVIKFNSTFLRVGVPANQDLIWLAVSYSGTDGQQVLHSNTTFRLLTDISDQARQLFGLREIEDERGVIYTKIEIRQPHVDWYRLRVSAHSEGADGRTHFETIFSLYINVAPNPFL